MEKRTADSEDEVMSLGVQQKIRDQMPPQALIRLATRPAKALRPSARRPAHFLAPEDLPSCSPKNPANVQVASGFSQQADQDSFEYVQTELLNHVSNAVIGTDNDDRIFYWNRHAERLYQWSAAEVKGRVVMEILGPSWRKSEKIDGLAAQNLWEGEEYCKRKDGTRFKGSITRAWIKNFEGAAVGMVSVTTDISERKRAEKQLRQSKQQLRALTAHLQWAREKERTRIAREIHDELGQALTGIKMDLSWLVSHHKQKSSAEEDVHFRNRLDRINEMLHQTIQEVRRISTELRPRVLDELGLIAALEWQARDFEVRTGIQCCFATNVEKIDLDDQRLTAIFRIFQETLTNILKHSEASRVNVVFLQRKQKVVLEVQDNGKGIPARKISGATSLGLLGMRERAYLAKGSLDIHSSTRTGTAITASFALSRSRKPSKTAAKLR